MLHALTSETKQQSERAQTQLPQRPHFSASPPFAPSYAPTRGGQSLAYLHSTYGNQAVLRMLSHSTPAIQAKLAINKPGDEFEQEADRVADQVMRMTTPALSIQRKCSGCEEEEKLQRKCGECVEEEKKKETEIQRKEASLGGEIAPPVVHDVLHSPGQPIDPSTRSFMEPRFGYDFSAVRVHTDGPAAESARAVNALAYTHGRNVVFGAGQYSPRSESGRQLLAHELAHVVQQSGEVGLRLYRKELPDEEIPKEWPLPNPATEGTEQCRWEEGDLKCYKVKCVQTEQNKTHCYYDGPYPPAPEPAKPGQPAPAPQTPVAKQALSGRDSKGQDYVVYEKEIRVGGTRPWRNNNPGNFDKPGDHPKNIGNDGRFLIFPDSASGKQELIDSVKAHGTSTIRSFITVHAPPSENDTEGYIKDVVDFMNNGSAIGECQIKKPAKLVNDGTVLGSLSDSEQSSFAMAMARKEGWCDVTQKKTIYDCQSASIPDEYKQKLVCP